MSSRNRKKISTRNKKEIVITENEIKIPEFKDLKIEMDLLKARETDLNNEKQNVIYKSNDKYFCESCNIYLLYKNLTKHNKTTTHNVKDKHNY